MQDCANASTPPSTAYIGVRQALPLVSTVDASVRGGGCDSYGGTGKSSCGPSDAPESMSAEVWEKISNHPGYSEEAHRDYARMHVAVAPACKIQCNYWSRKYDCSNESRPGVVSEKRAPEQP